MAFLAEHQLPDGGWYYGKLRRQHWIDSFHTSYNVCALLDYQRMTGDRSFETGNASRAIDYYESTFFTAEGAPKYFHNRTFPIDIHACSQAILHFAAFSGLGAGLAKTLSWTMKNMRRLTVRFLPAPSPGDQPHALYALGAGLDVPRARPLAVHEPNYGYTNGIGWIMISGKLHAHLDRSG